MRSAVNTLFFLAMLPLGLMAAELGPLISNAQDPAVEGDAQHSYFQEDLLQQGGAHEDEQAHRGLRVQSANLLKLHNKARCRHNANPLKNSNKLTNSAKAHAKALSDSCGALFHSSGSKRDLYGENVYVCGRKSCYTPEKAMNNLYNREIKDRNSVTKYGGHATQILWKASTKLGCATSTCSRGSSHKVYLVCQYDPPGNNPNLLKRNVKLPSPKKSC